MLVATHPATSFDTAEIKHCLGMYKREYVREFENGRRRNDLVPSLTDPDSMADAGETLWFAEDGDQVGAAYHLPLEGHWSDLIAEFVFFVCPDGTKMGLISIRVM